MLKTLILAVTLVLVNLSSGRNWNTNFIPAARPQPSAALFQSETINFAVIGDYGNGGKTAGQIAELVKSWNPEFITTVGDNNYAGGKCCFIDRNVGKFYHQYIYPYRGTYGQGATTNRFFPTLGNHDWQGDAFQSYQGFFDLPGNGRYYDFAWGPVHFFMLDSNIEEPDGNTATSIQANWLKRRLAQATEPWKLVFLHSPPYSSGKVHGSDPPSQWPYREWGATAILAGDDHLYERIVIDGFPYFVNGLGGVSVYDFEDVPVPGSQVRYNGSYGAQLVTADACAITFNFYALKGGQVPIDSYTIRRCTVF